MKDYILCLDSSDRYLSVGIGCDGALLTSIRYEAWQKQSEFMVEEISSLCQKLGINPHDFKGVSISKGPGSYTGIRIALTIGKVIAFSLQ
ncbi:MAG: tRNA (adenosine(37)-N6)-threonylcarbamoyltransferase complex dimerization subunit type 1 TsaB, partial [Bacilli bacterium]|nr:tRNA (adenosine(37)-N6)-threonylcarbamoyltransferase complex dimerization subunit type 1 TsaB [Bacilli bacterium]